MYLFFIRAFNDVDHFTPIIWKMNRDNYPVVVYCINPEYDIQNDYRLNFLRDNGVRVDYIYNELAKDLGIFHRIMRFLYQTTYDLQKRIVVDSRFSSRLQGLAHIAAKFLYHLTRKKYYGLDWARNILERNRAQVLCFDWVTPKRYVVDVLLRAAEEMAVMKLALPHGVYLYTNDLYANNLLKIDSTKNRLSEKREQFNRYDYIVVQNRLYQDVMSASGVERQKIIVLGSARYCDEWMMQHKKILPRVMKSADEDTGSLKVVFMTTRSRYRIKVERMIRTFDMLSKMKGVDIRVKPHTRTNQYNANKDVGMFTGLPFPNAAAVSSVELCEWADVILVVGSSIIIEALKLHKPVLYLKFLHENITEYEKFGACWIIHNETELQEALMSLKKTKTKVPYRNEDVNKWLSEIIYGGRDKRDVLADYEALILDCAKRGKPS